ncbi:hypothetical protein CJO91_03550 [Ralstonia solanacearum]|nr:hypothetical protein CJO83_03290 [Ralstonia solanacearum]AXW42160.1 hypothetical protein CJO90_03285 [Ralstonia solanacearum]AXW46867.1 hypothetical protein CJO91_03550 [Ralstonia solanacearum]AXW65470.1 hypothetical protein CJO95_03285 [Ralstonia solanacearum]
MKCGVPLSVASEELQKSADDEWIRQMLCDGVVDRHNVLTHGSVGNVTHQIQNMIPLMLRFPMFK